MSNNIRTMELIGFDDFSRAVYKCVETGKLYKNVAIKGLNPELYSCGNIFDGIPDQHIEDNLEIHFKKITKQTSEEDKFNYQMLDRLRSDCNYYLGYGNRNSKSLWANDEQEQINEMKKLYNSFSDDKKPEWLTYEQILEYEKEMVNK
jgi:hypothetical protein